MSMMIHDALRQGYAIPVSFQARVTAMDVYNWPAVGYYSPEAYH